MKPYYDRDGITIYHGDCRDVLPTLRADLVLTDPPFGIGLDYGAFVDTPDAVRALVSETVPMMRAAARTTFCTPGVYQMWLYPRPDWVLAYFNPAGERMSAWGFSTWQPVLAYGVDPFLNDAAGSRPDGWNVHRPQTYTPPGHPCPKHPDVWGRLMGRGLGTKGRSIIDPFMGSGTSLVVAAKEGVAAIGIEIEERYCEIAAKRLAQGVLPFGDAK